MNPTSLSWFIKFYKILNKNELNPIFINDMGDDIPEHYSQIIMDNSIDIGYTKLDVFYSQRSKLFKFFYRSVKLIYKTLISNLFFLKKVKNSTKKKIDDWIINQKMREREIEKIIYNYNPRAIFLVGDRNGRYIPSILKIASSKKIKLIIPPIAYIADKEILGRKTFRFNDPNHILDDHSEIIVKYPNQFYMDPISGKSISYFQNWEIEARLKTDNLIRNPWTIGSSDLVTVCVNSEVEKSKLVKNKVYKKNIIVAGSIEYDSLFINFSKKSSVKKNIYKKYSLDNSKKLIILGFPVLWEHGLLSRKDTIRLYSDYCKIVLKTDYNILISFHPKCQIDNYNSIIKKYKIKVLNNSLSEVIPTADIYITGQGSTTGLWSIACKVPLIISDYSGLDYDMFSNFKGVKVSKTFNDFEQTILDIASNSKKRDVIKDDLGKNKDVISKFDGKNQIRILEQIPC